MVGEGEQADAGSSNPRTEHSDAVGVSSEEADVLADPPQSLDLVQEPVVPFSSLVARTEEACNAHTNQEIENLQRNHTQYATAILFSLHLQVKALSARANPTTDFVGGTITPGDSSGEIMTYWMTWLLVK